MKGLTSNNLKVIGICLMILDHIGYYFISYIPKDVFNNLRFFGRMAMPIFAFLIVQGFFHTHDLKKYILRLFIVATVFQAILFGMGIINKVYVKNYYIVINTYLNILYSFVLCLVILWLMEKKEIVKNKFLNYIFKIVGIAVILLIYHFVEIELGYRVVVTIVGMYIAEKLRRKGKNDEIVMGVLFITLVLALFTDYKRITFNLPSIISLLFISLYNGEIGKKNKFLKNIFYIIYPLHHVILYTTALFITYKVR